jgi:hypothetical protein
VPANTTSVTLSVPASIVKKGYYVFVVPKKGDKEGYYSCAHVSPNLLHGNTLKSNEELKLGEYLQSNNGSYLLIMQNDSNLVLYQGYPWKSLWSNGTWNMNITQCIMKSNGEFAMYSNGSQCYSSKTSNNPGAYMIMQDNGNLVIYNASGKAIWSTNTAQ